MDRRAFLGLLTAAGCGDDMTFSRRPNPRLNRRSVSSGGPGGFNPANISGNLDYWQSFVGGKVSDPKITIVTGVSSWQSQTSSNAVTEGTGANQPTWNASDATLNNLRTVTSDGTNDRLALAAYNRPAPGTTPTAAYVLMKMDTWTAEVFLAMGAAALSLQGITAGPRVCQLNPTTANGNDGFVANGTWKRLIAFWNNDTSDFTLVGGSTVTGTASGNNAGGNLTFFANNGLTQFFAGTYAYLQLFSALPTAQNIQDLDGYLAGLIGSTAPFS